MVKFIKKRLLPMLLAVVMVVCMLPLAALAATTVEPVTGRIQVTDSVGTGTLSGGTVIITATGGTMSRTTNTITLTNISGVIAKISFDYVISGNYNSYSGFESTSGSYSKIFTVGESATFEIESQALKRKATLKLSNFAFTEATSKINATFEYDSNLGSVTVDGAAIATGTNFEIDPAVGASLVATPVSGATFLAWINTSDNTILSPNASYSFKEVEDITVKAVFVNGASVPHFMVEDKYLFDDLAVATAKAASSTSNKTVVLMNNATLPAGNYTIPSGVTLLIPFDAANTLCTTQPSLLGEARTQYKTPTAYRTLNMAEGANLTVNGALSLSSQYTTGQGSVLNAGSPAGSCSFINMNSNSTITINSGAVLYAWGFITGSGSVIAKNGSKVYENFQMQDWRGGEQATDMDNSVFPVSQYYVQNIEVPLTIEAGATEYAFTSVKVTLFGEQKASIAFFASSGAMFNLASGSVTKRYDGTTDRLIVDINGEISISPLSMKMGIYGIDSKDYNLNINSNITINAYSGSEVKIEQNISLLPGTVIYIAEGAKYILKENINVYVYDANDWGNYCGPGNQALLPVTYAPSKTYTRTAADLVDAKIQIDGTIDASNGFVYVTNGGANVTSSSSGKIIMTEGSQEKTYQLIQAPDPKNSTYVEIPLTAPVLKNSDGSVLQTATNTYTYTDGFWRCETHTYKDEVTAPTCTEKGYTTHTCDTCVHVAVDTYTDELGHKYGEWTLTKEPTYSQEGSKTHSCSVCGDVETVAIEVITVPDINGDGNFDALDLAKFRKIILGIDTLPENVYKTITDLNDDNKVNILDLIRIKKRSLEK